MMGTIRHGWLGIGAAGVLSVGALLSGVPGPGRAQAIPIHASPRTSRALMRLNWEQVRWKKLRATVDIYDHPAVRMKIAPQAIPLLRRMERNIAVSLRANLPPQWILSLKIQTVMTAATLALFDDKPTLADIRRGLKSRDLKTKLDARLKQYAMAWWREARNPAAQYKVLSQFSDLGRKHPSAVLEQVMYQLATRGAATPEIARDMDDTGGEIQAGPATQGWKMFFQEQRVTNQVAGREFHLYGAAINGRIFSTYLLKDKPCIIDFWATWCPWCVRELPDMAKLYNRYHAKGLRIVSVSEDNNLFSLRRFLQQHPEMKWVQLYRKKGFYVSHGASRALPVVGYPTTIILNRRGVVQDMIIGYSPGQIDSDIKPMFVYKKVVPTTPPARNGK